MQQQVVNARRTESMDAPAITKLVSNTTEQVFGRVNVVNLIERANLAVTLVNQEEELMGHASFFDYPNLPGVDQGHWETWLSDYYNTKSCTSLNTLFMHFFVARPEYSHGAAKEIITTVFNAVPEVHYVFLMVPKTGYPEAALTTVFSQMNRLDDSRGLDKHVLFSCGRDQFVPVLHVRKARVQDHDDLTPIFNRQSDMLNNTYGDFFLAELIEAQDESMHCLVAEIEETAVGFMSLCTEVNLDLLNNCFDLGPLHGLRKPHPEDVTQKETTPIPVDVAPSVKTAKSVKSASTVDPRDGSVTPGEGVEGDTVGVQRRLSEEMLDYMSDISGSLSTSRASSIALDKVGSSLEEIIAAPVDVPQSPAKPEPQLPSLSKPFVPQYFGESNAFSIQLFCVDEHYEMRSVDLLKEAFSRMPDKEFAVMTVPHLVPEFPLIQKFLRMSPRLGSTLPQELYVFHKMGLTEDFIVRDAKLGDYEAIENLTSTLTMQENLLKDLQKFNAAKRDQDGTELRAYVAQVADQIVGVAVIRREEEIEYLRANYNIEDFIYYNHHGRNEHGHLHHFALNPIFAHFSKHFLKEVLRKSYKTALYYPIYPAHSKLGASKHSLLTCLNEMIPVRPRRQIMYPLEVLQDRAPSKRILQQQEPHALCHINRKLTLEPKVVVNARIVVVGASTVALSFLETLVFCPHLGFNNLILISPHGLPGELPPDELRENLLGTEHCYSEAEHSRVSLRSWVNVVYGKMTKIDRNKKHVVVNGEKIVTYDHLVIATGEQHQLPQPTGLSETATVDNPPTSPDRWFVGTPPKNLLICNDEYDAAVSLYWMEQNYLKQNTNSKVLVHGSVLRAYCTVQALVKLGVQPQNIVMVKSKEDGSSCFNDPLVETAIKSTMLDDYGMTVEDDCILAEWNIDEENNITEATFLTPEGTFTTECSVMFSYTQPRVDLDAFQAVNNACLVFDGKLVIDTTFHTNDIAIRAAGPVTKYQRRYHADSWTHKIFNSKEIGIELASAMLVLFDPTVEQQLLAEDDELKLIPMYRSPKVQGGLLPGDLHYVHIGKPSLPLSLAAQMMNPEYGTVLSTGEPVGKPDKGPYVSCYFRLHFNVYNSVETITCLSQKPIEVSNILCLYGLHQRFLNNVMQRYKEGLIKDFYSYFNEAWCLALFHDRFSDFRDEIRELLVNQPAPDVGALEEKVRELINEDLQLDQKQRKNLHEIYADTGGKRAVETRLLGYLSYNYYHLPMYAKPGMV